MSEGLSDLMRPKTWHPVRELVEQAGIDVSDWAKDRNDVEIKNPNANVYKSFKWSFGGSGQPVALCIWHEEVDWDSDPPTRTGKTKTQQEELNALGNSEVSSAVAALNSLRAVADDHEVKKASIYLSSAFVKA